MRVKIPPIIEKGILLANKHCCCICQYYNLGQEIIIHHIDGNNSNNNPSNLSVLCLIHASQADAGLKKGKLGSGKKLKPTEVKEYKKIWEEKVRTEIDIFKHKQKISLNEKELFQLLYIFEINKLSYEIISTDNTNRNKIDEKFDFLDSIMIEEAISGIKIKEKILDIYGDMAFICSNSDYKILKIIEGLKGLNFYIDKTSDQKRFLKSLTLLEIIGKRIIKDQKDLSLLEATCKTIYSLSDTSMWSQFKKGEVAIENILEKMKKSYFDKKEPKDEKVISILDETIKKIRENKKEIEEELNYARSKGYIK